MGIESDDEKEEEKAESEREEMEGGAEMCKKS